jgi:hypothetical protein
MVFPWPKVVNGKSPPESNRPKERKKTLDDFDRCVIPSQAEKT